MVTMLTGMENQLTDIERAEHVTNDMKYIADGAKGTFIHEMW